MPPTQPLATARRALWGLSLLAFAGTAAAQDSGTIGIRLRLTPPPSVEWRGALFETAQSAEVLEGELRVRCQEGQRFRLDAPTQLERGGRHWRLSGTSGEQVCSGRAQQFAFLARLSGATREQGHDGQFGVTFY